jgi:hypothetical protein
MQILLTYATRADLGRLASVAQPLEAPFARGALMPQRSAESTLHLYSKVSSLQCQAGT